MSCRDVKGRRQRRPTEQKAAKPGKKRKVVGSGADNGIKEESYNYTSRFLEANTASVEAAREDDRMKGKIAKKVLELKGEVSKLETLKMLFGGSDEKSMSY